MWLSRPSPDECHCLIWILLLCTLGEQGYCYLVNATVTFDGKVTSQNRSKMVIKDVMVCCCIYITINFIQSSHTMRPQIITGIVLGHGGHLHTGLVHLWLIWKSPQYTRIFCPIIICDSLLNVTWFLCSWKVHLRLSKHHDNIFFLFPTRTTFF